MGYSIYFQAHINGFDQEISVRKIIDVFEPFVKKKDEFGLEIEYDEENSSFILIDITKENCTHFSVERPCADKRFYSSLFKACQFGNFISLYPEGTCIVFDPKTLGHIPKGMKEAINDGSLTCETTLTENHYLNKVFNT